MRYILDRFEGGYAVLENQDTLEVQDVPRSDLPPSCQEGDLLVFQGGTWSREDNLDRAKRIQEKMDRLFRE